MVAEFSEAVLEAVAGQVGESCGLLGVDEELAEALAESVVAGLRALA